MYIQQAFLSSDSTLHIKSREFLFIYMINLNRTKRVYPESIVNYSQLSSIGYVILLILLSDCYANSTNQSNYYIKTINQSCLYYQK